jgi:hypothetical protein
MFNVHRGTLSASTDIFPNMANIELQGGWRQCENMMIQKSRAAKRH